METLINLLITSFTPVGFDPIQAIGTVKGDKTNNSNSIAKD